MNPDSFVPEAIDSQRLHEILAIVHAQVATALWLSAGMVLATAGSACVALGWRKAALSFGFFYGLTLCFIHNGHARVLGPVGCVIALGGFLWRVERSRRFPKSAHDPL